MQWCMNGKLDTVSKVNSQNLLKDTLFHFYGSFYPGIESFKK